MTATHPPSAWGSLLAILLLVASTACSSEDGPDREVAQDAAEDARTSDDASTDPGNIDADTDVDVSVPDDVVTDVDVGLADDAEEDAGPLPAWPAPFGAANVLEPDDTRYEGQSMFLYDTWGAEVLGGWPDAAFLLRVLEEEPEVFGPQFANFGYLPNPNADLPVGLARGTADAAGVGETRAMCHVGALPDGRLWYGAPNPLLDVRGLRRELNARWVAAGNPPLLTALEIEKSHAYGPGRTGADSDEYPRPVPADFPPYYRLGERTALNYLGTGRDVRTEIYFAIFTVGAGAPNDATARVPFPDEERLATFVAYLGSIEAPQGPRGDVDQVARGAEVFASARCVACHMPGDPAAHGVIPVDRDPEGRERIPGDDPAWPRGSIRTSLAHRVLIDGDPDNPSSGADDGRADLVRFLVARRLSVRASDGYRSPPLEGVWSTAPYLHNGSVPTLRSLLDPVSERPSTFERARGFVVDTSESWNSNEGHEFGIDLSDEDKDALVAYLESL